MRRASTTSNASPSEPVGAVHADWRPSTTFLPRLLAPTPHTGLLKRAEVLFAAQLELARRSPNAFLELAFTDPHGAPLRQAWFHEEWQHAMSEHARVVLVGPRGHGKSTQVVGRILWELGRDPDLRIKIVCASQAKAADLLRQVRAHIEHNGLVRAVFPALRPDRRATWTGSQLVVKRQIIMRDPSVEALSITSSVTGGRADLLIADDVVDQRNALHLPALRDKVKQAWFSTWTQLLMPGGRVVYICTPWHDRDLSRALLENSAYTALQHAVGADGEAIWPEVWDQEKLLARKEEIGSVEFARAYMNQPRDDSQAAVRPEWIQYVAEDAFLASCRKPYVLLSYDLATGESSEGDYFACVAFVVDRPRKSVLVKDAYRAHLTAPEQARQIAADARRHGCHEVVVEGTGYQMSLVQYIRDQEPWLRVQTAKPQISKRLRLDRVTPHMANAQILFSETLDPDALDGDRGDLVGELLDFPFGKHDDLVDAFTQGSIFLADSFLHRWDDEELLEERYAAEEEEEEEEDDGYAF